MAQWWDVFADLDRPQPFRVDDDLMLIVHRTPDVGEHVAAMDNGGCDHRMWHRNAEMPVRELRSDIAVRGPGEATHASPATAPIDRQRFFPVVLPSL